jgi:uncharacterized protein
MYLFEVSIKLFLSKYTSNSRPLRQLHNQQTKNSSYGTLLIDNLLPILILQDMLEIIIILIAIGTGAGVAGSIIGIGGGIFFTPVLTLLGLQPSQIASTSLIAVTFTGISSTISYVRQKRINYKLGLKMALLSIPGAISGAFFSSLISIVSFKFFFAIMLILVVLYIMYNNDIRREKLEKGLKAFLAGVLSSLFGIGGGIIFVPTLIIIMNMKMNKAAPTSQLTIMISSLTGLIVHIILGHPNYEYALSLASGAFIGGIIGAELSGYIKERILQILLSISLLLVSIKLLYDVVQGN